MDKELKSQSNWNNLYAAIIAILVLIGLGISMKDGLSSDPAGYLLFGFIIWLPIRIILGTFHD